MRLLQGLQTPLVTLQTSLVGGMASLFPAVPDRGHTSWFCWRLDPVGDALCHAVQPANHFGFLIRTPQGSTLRRGSLGRARDRRARSPQNLSQLGWSATRGPGTHLKLLNGPDRVSHL
jgi:hypothetical protein